MMMIISWTFFGLLVGAIARLLIPGRQSMGWLATIFLGVVGSYAGGFIKYLLWGGDALQPSGIFLSVIGAILAVIIGSKLTNKNELRSTH